MLALSLSLKNKNIKKKTIKTIYDKPTDTIIFNSEKLKAFLLRSQIIQGCPLSPLLFNIVLKVLPENIGKKKKEKEKTSPKRKEAVKIMFVDDMILYTENPKHSIRSY